MKKHLYFILCLAVSFLTACSSEDELTNMINFDSPYVIKDNPSDPIQHRRYQIYEKYGVSVFFNDTLSQKYVGERNDGSKIYQYETLDFNWNFSSHNKDNVTYRPEYLESIEDMEKGLNFAEAFLNEASKAMRPFSLFLPKTFTIEEKGRFSTPEFWSGFRTLVIPAIQSIQEESVKAFSHDILLSMVKDKVKNNSTFVAAFGEISKQKYGKPWVLENNNGGLGCQWGVEHVGTYWKPSELYEDGMYQIYLMDPSTNVSSEEEFNAERSVVFSQIGQFGFISGDSYLDHLMSPKNVNEDLTCYLDTMLSIGSKLFLERYGKSTLVLKKYNMLANYINHELGIDF